MTQESLNNVRVLIVEDEPMLAFVLRTMVEDAGGEVVGPSNSVQGGLDLLGKEKFDCAIIDVRLNEEVVYPLADAMSEKDIPFAFVTGNSSNTLPPEHQQRPILLKPVSSSQLISVISKMQKSA